MFFYRRIVISMLSNNFVHSFKRITGTGSETPYQFENLKWLTSKVLEITRNWKGPINMYIFNRSLAHWNSHTLSLIHVSKRIKRITLEFVPESRIKMVDTIDFVPLKRVSISCFPTTYSTNFGLNDVMVLYKGCIGNQVSLTKAKLTN